MYNCHRCSVVNSGQELATGGDGFSDGKCFVSVRMGFHYCVNSKFL